MTALAPAVLRSLRRLRSRENVERLTAQRLRALREAFAALYQISDERGYAYHAGIHGLPLPMYCQHGTDLFLPWHRAYLYFFELALRDRAPDVTVPWWDWTSPASRTRGIPRAYANRRLDGRQNPLYSAAVPPAARQGGQPRRTSRAPRPPSLLPTRQEVERILNLGDFLDFQRQLENVHGAIHVWVRGTMGSVPWAAYDPIFWTHHSMVDRLWRIWQARHTSAGPPAPLLGRALPPFPMTVADTLDVTALGYEYAASTTTVAGAGG